MEGCPRRISPPPTHTDQNILNLKGFTEKFGKTMVGAPGGFCAPSPDLPREYSPFVWPGVLRHSSWNFPKLILSPCSLNSSAWAPLALAITLRTSFSCFFISPEPVTWSAWTCVFTVRIQQNKNAIPVGCVPSERNRTAGGLPDRPPLDRDPRTEIPLWTETPPDIDPPLWTESQTGVKTLPCCNFVAGGNQWRIHDFSCGGANSWVWGKNLLFN